MTYLITKTLVSALLIVAISEIGKRVPLWGAIIASLPLTSIIAMVWLYRDTGSAEQVRALSSGIFWMVLPSLIFFVALSGLLKAGYRFPVSLTISCVIMIACYAAYVKILSKIGIHI